jgi:hypothetical protein
LPAQTAFVDFEIGGKRRQRRNDQTRLSHRACSIQTTAGIMP